MSSKWKLTNDEYEFIKGEVIHVFELYDIKGIPVNGFEIAIKMGITLRPYSSLSKKKLKAALKESQDGLYGEYDGKEYIFYNDIDRCYERQNMTILHEIGHCVLDHTGHSEHEEDEANFFAKYAIAPPVLVDKIGAECPEDIYNAFDISYEAAVYNMFNIYLNENDLRAGSKYPVIALLNEAANDNLIEFLNNIHDKIGSGYNYSTAYFWDELDDYDKENTDMFSGIRIETEGGEEITVSIEEIMYYMNILVERCQLSDTEKEEVQRIIGEIISEN